MIFQSNEYKLSINSSNQSQILEHLSNCSKQFTPELDTYVDLNQYSEKVFSHATRFEIFFNNSLIGLLAVYQKTKEVAFVTNLSVDNEHNGKGLAKKLLNYTINHLSKDGTKEIDLEVFKQNKKAYKFYLLNNFIITNESIDKYVLKHTIL